MVKWMLALCVVGLVGSGFGQTYSPEREKFVKEFSKSVKDYADKEDQKFIDDELEPMLLESTDFSENYFTQMVETSNKIIDKNMNAYPEVFNYVFSVYSFVKNKQPQSSYNSWHDAIDKMLASRRARNFDDFSEMSATFFSEKIIASKSNFSWYYEGGDYKFTFDRKPYIHFSKGNLVCRIHDKNTDKNKNQFADSIHIENAVGVYNPLQTKWDGQAGKVTWEKVGVDATSTFAKLGNHQISMRTSNLSVDTVQLTTPYFEHEIAGKFSDKAFKINRDVDEIYPQFLSFEQGLSIDNIKPNINYSGGFSMRGAAFVGAGTVKNPAEIIYLKESKPFVKMGASRIYIEKDRIRAANAKSVIYLKTGDSIVHPGLDFNYALEEQLVEFSRPSSGIGQAPFHDSYHQLDLYVPKITWKEEEQTLHLTFQKGSAQEQRIARLESFNFFDDKLYASLQGMSSTHPLVGIHSYSYKYDKYVLTEGECATALGGTVEQVKRMMLSLSAYGFISYDTENKKVYINEKLENFVLARSGERDYDNISFVADFRTKKLEGYTQDQINDDPYLRSVDSTYKKQNVERSLYSEFGNMDLNTLVISMKGVDKISLSDIQNVHVFPENATVTINENRSFDFSGWMNAGKMEIETQVANYSYAENKVNLVETNKSLFRMQPLRKQDGNRSIATQSSLSKLAGTIYIDNPESRSGKLEKKYPDYPKISVTNPSYIYYNSNSIQRGAYDSTRFYYTVEPFEMDSLDNFAENDFHLSGELNSAGIFPPMKEDLQLMPDYSFGFSTKAPDGGMDFYQTGAKYENKIVLSNNGLQGAGTINFIHSTSVSKALTFLPDSTIGYAVFVNKPSETAVEFPSATCKKALITYLPTEKRLKAASTRGNEISMFDNETSLKGEAIITPEGMRGKGLVRFSTAQVASNDYSFKHDDINADSSSFNLINQYKEEGEDPLAFETKNVTTHISFEDRKGVFTSNEGESPVEFPVNQYICKMDKFTWFMDQEEIEMSKGKQKELTIDTELDLNQPNFFSIHPKQDSLQFRSPKAKYNMKEKTIYCSEVDYINVADARIFPDSSKIQIRKKAKMDELTNAKIVANYITKYHTFENATVQIKARRDYEGTGDYPYYNRDSVATIVKMNKIELDDSKQTFASGEVTKDANFKLSEEFDFYGELSIQASKPFAYFDGATRINHGCDKFERNWLAFETEIDPNNIQIPVAKEMKNLDNDLIAAGIVWRDSPVVDSIRLYPTFLSALEGKEDPVVMTSNGVLTYAADANEFQIASREKLINRGGKGNFIALHTKSCSMYGDGAVDLGLDLADVKMNSIGVVNYNQETGETTMNLTTKIDMDMDKRLLKDVAKRINEVEGLKAMDFASTTLESAVTQWASQKEADKLVEDYTVKGEVKKFPKEMEASMVFTGIRLSSYDNDDNPNFKGLITNVNSAVLVNFVGEPVMKYVPFRAFFQQKYSKVVGGDKFSMLIDIPGGRDYFFDYSVGKKLGTMNIVSGDSKFAGSINDMSDDKRKSKDFKYQIGRNSLKTVFYNLFAE